MDDHTKIKPGIRVARADAERLREIATLDEENSNIMRLEDLDLAVVVARRDAINFGYQGDVKNHVVPACFGVQMLAEACERGWLHEPWKSSVWDRVHIDVSGGMVHKHEPMRGFRIDGYLVETYAFGLADLRHEIAIAEPRTFSDGTAYQKLYGRLHCWLLPLAWREPMLDSEWFAYRRNDKAASA